ncbi:hypothetical protein GCM10009850_051530 [Nonomuraea monospora]|uniref:Transposase n=1 Tax=Nonomuraea monospora TaxID=568818 RepID=A0ABP5PDU7_9ACTN
MVMWSAKRLPQQFHGEVLVDAPGGTKTARVAYRRERRDAQNGKAEPLQQGGAAAPQLALPWISGHPRTSAQHQLPLPAKQLHPPSPDGSACTIRRQVA